MGLIQNYTRAARLRALGLLSLLGLASFVFLWNLGASSISVRSDEVIYVRTTQSILHNGELLPLKHGNVPMYEKPPLKLWLGSIAPLIFGESNFSFRILDGLLGIFVVGATALLAFSMTKSMLIALSSGMLLLGMPELVIAQHSFRHAVLDGLLCALTLLGAALSWRISASTGAPTRRSSHALGAIWSLAVLTKSVAGLVPAACSLLAIIVVCRGRVAPSNRRNLAWIIILPLLVFGAYAALLWLLAGTKALKIFLGVEILDRVFSGFEGHNTGSSGFYLWYLFVRAGAVPQALICSGLLGACLSCLHDKRLQFLLVWSVVPVLLYSCAASRVPWYLSPYLPFIAMLSTAGVVALLTRLKAWRGRPTALLTLAAIAALSLPPFYRAVSRNVDEIAHDTSRLEIDQLVTRLRSTYSDFTIIDNAISGHSNPRNGRFNVEGIYRESLRPNLRAAKHIRELDRRPNEVLFVREDQVSDLPQGWHEVGRLEPYGSRTWSVIAVIYLTEDVEGSA